MICILALLASAAVPSSNASVNDDCALDGSEPHNAVEEAIPAEASPTEEPYTIAPEEDPLPEDTLPAEEAFSKEDPMGKERIAPQATLEAS